MRAPINIENAKMTFGLRRSNRSLRVYEVPNEKYLGIEKKYFLGICYSKKVINFKNYSEAQDHIIYFKNDGLS